MIFLRCFCSITAVFALAVVTAADEFALHTFQRQQLTDVYFSEGANAGDVNGDKVADVVYGPYWFAGPDYSTRHEIYEPVPQNRDRYADNFFNWIYDFNGDGWQDVLVVGFPSKPAFVYENPGPDGHSNHWPKHQVFDWVSNESPQFVNLVGDDRPELVCTRDGFFGYASIDWDEPFSTWTFHPISEQITATRFGHGLGIGDVNGDGRNDIIHSKGWFEQPESKAGESRWLRHDVSFSQSYGGAEMYAYDVDGDGDNDIITSHAAHDFGLGWYEQIRSGDEIAFEHHLIMGTHPSENKYGVVFSELHSIALEDMDGDGLKDIVTGKTYWSHHRQSPMWDAGAVVYWFKLVRTKDGVDWIPYQADTEAGIGRQVSVVDVNGDKLPDIVIGGMLGAHVLTHEFKKVTKQDWQSAQPKVYTGPKLPSVDGAQQLRGPKANIDPATGKVDGALEGEELKPAVSAGSANSQKMSNFKSDRWSGDSQMFWVGAQPGDTLTLDLPELPANAELEIVMTCASDYGIVQLSLNDKKLGDPIDLYNPNVVTTGVLRLSNIESAKGKSQLKVQMAGANPRAKRAFMFGLDYVRIVPGKERSEKKS